MGDCQRRAVHIAYDIPLWTMPPARPVDGAQAFHEAWEEWAERNGYALWYSESLAPTFMPRWIASVSDKRESGSHAVVMQFADFLIDPNEMEIRKGIDQLGGLDPLGMLGRSHEDELHTAAPLDTVLAAQALVRVEHLDALNARRNEMQPIGGPPQWMIDQAKARINAHSD